MLAPLLLFAGVALLLAGLHRLPYDNKAAGLVVAGGLLAAVGLVML